MHISTATASYYWLYVHKVLHMGIATEVLTKTFCKLFAFCSTRLDFMTTVRTLSDARSRESTSVIMTVFPPCIPFITVLCSSECCVWQGGTLIVLQHNDSRYNLTVFLGGFSYRARNNCYRLIKCLLDV